MPYVYLYTGDGVGKTTNALGLVVRMLGHKKKILMVQFLKWDKNTGEYLFSLDKTSKFEVLQFGREGWHGFDNIEYMDKVNSYEALKAVRDRLSKDFYDLVILDEINLAVYLGLITDEDVITLLDEIPISTNVVLTGRHATKALIDRADFVNELVVIKQPKNIPCEEGIQF